MEKLKVCVYSVCKNESAFVDRWVDSMNEADLVVVTDTGSSDDTVEKLKQRGVEVYIDVIKPWRFDTARNSCLKHIPEDFDICVSTDLDEIFEPGWRKNLEKAWQPDTKRARYHFTWSFNEDGTPGVTFFYDRIHARKDYEWINPTHETLHYLGTEEEKSVWCENVRLQHYPDKSKDRSFNLPLLELAIQERPEEERNYHYLGREYMFAGMWDKCIETLEYYLSMPRATWKDERSASMRFIARAYKAKKENLNAKAWLYKAIIETPFSREPYLEMAKLMYDEQNWSGAYHMVDEALKIKQRTTYINDAWCWDHTLDDLGAISSYYLGMYDRSLEHAKAAVAFRPNDGRLINNLKLIEEKINGIKA